MSQAALAALREGNALAQTLTFEELEAYHVPFDEMTGERSVEHELEYWAARKGRVALVGESGAGKSSVMAAVLGAFSESVPESLVPTRIPVELAEDAVVTDAGGFGRHVVSHILSWAAPEVLTDAERQELERRTADLERRSGRRRRGGFSIGTSRLLPFDVQLSGDLTGAAEDFDRQLSNGEAVLALRRLVALFRARGREPLLVFDDSDTWLQLPGQEADVRDRASGFFGTNIRMLSRELDCGIVLAVHRSYLELPAYQGIADSLEHIELPALSDPVAAITAILRRRIDVDELGIELSDAFDENAIEALAAIYGDVPDLRRVMAIAGLAVRKAHDDEDAVIVTKEAVFAARSQRDTYRGSS